MHFLLSKITHFTLVFLIFIFIHFAYFVIFFSSRFCLVCAVENYKILAFIFVFLLTVYKLTDPNCLNESSGVMSGKGDLSIQTNENSNRRHISCKFDKIQVTKVERTKKEGAENVAEEKFFLIFQTDIQVGNKKFPVHNFCFVKFNEKNRNNPII